MAKYPPSTAEANQALVDKVAEMVGLVSGLAHEIKNPLSTIQLNMEMLAEDLSDEQDPRNRRALAKVRLVQWECQRLTSLLEDFLNFAKAGRLKLEPANLNHQVQQMLQFFAPKAKESGIEVIDYLASDLPTVLLDRKAFQGALLNLVLNAQQAMPGGGSLVLRTSVRGNGVALDLIDTGKGIDEKMREHIFDAFVSTKPGGSGLGLPTARKIIEAHGGQIAVQSEVGRGTQVTIQLPIPPRLASANPEPSLLPSR